MFVAWSLHGNRERERGAGAELARDPDPPARRLRQRRTTLIAEPGVRSILVVAPGTPHLVLRTSWAAEAQDRVGRRLDCPCRMVNWRRRCAGNRTPRSGKNG